jgi:hypothetical protein
MEVDKMSIRRDHEMKTLEIDTRLLELFRLYENGIRLKLSEMEWKEISTQTMINEFSSYIEDRLPVLLENEERGDMHA